MILILLFTVIVFCSIFAIIRSGKSLKHIAQEVKLEFIFNLIGARALWEDKTMQKQNVIKGEMKKNNNNSFSYFYNFLINYCSICRLKSLI